jgi:hypothetical protein
MNVPWWLPEKVDVLYGAIVGGLVAFLSSLLTVSFTSWHALKRQRIDLAHQAEQKEKERQHALKREIYVPVVEAASAAVAFLAQIPTVPFEALHADNPVVQLARQVARLSLVASGRGHGRCACWPSAARALVHDTHERALDNPQDGL